MRVSCAAAAIEVYKPERIPLKQRRNRNSLVFELPSKPLETAASQACRKISY
jgi:hypothetical protein